MNDQLDDLDFLTDITNAQTKFDMAWKLLCLKAGKKSAREYAQSKIMGGKQIGRPREDPELVSHIEFLLSATQGSISPARLAEQIIKYPPRKWVPLKGHKPNPRVYTYIDEYGLEQEDVDTDEKFFEIKLTVPTLSALKKKIERVRDKMIENGNLPRGCKKSYSRG